MKKSVIAIIGIIMLLMPIMAFARGNTAAAGSQDWSDPTLRVLNYTDLTQANTMADQGYIWGTFQDNHPNITILKEDLFNEPFHQKTEAYAASGNMPDVLYVWPSGRSTSLHTNHLLKDLTPLINRDGLRSQFSAASLDPTQQASGYVAMIPQGITASHVMLVNMEVLNACGLQPATTYDEMKAQVPILAANGYECIIMPNQDDWVMQSCLFSAVAGRFGGADWHERILAGQAKFTDPEFVNALNFIKTLYDDGVIARSSLGMSYGDGPGIFAANRGAYYIDGDWRIGNFLTDSSTGQALISPARQQNIRVTVFPDIPGAKINKTTTAVAGTGWAMNAAIPAGSAREAAAWELIKWLVGRDVMSLSVEHGGIPTPSRTDINTASMPLEPLQIALSNLGSQFTASTAVIDGVFESDVFQPINDGLQELGIAGGRTPQQIAQTVQQAFDRWRTANPIRR